MHRWRPRHRSRDRINLIGNPTSVNFIDPSPSAASMDTYTRERVLAKTFAWRVIATLTGAAIAGTLGDGLETAGWFIAIEFPLKMAFYYVHERAWEGVPWGISAPSA